MSLEDVYWDIDVVPVHRCPHAEDVAGAIRTSHQDLLRDLWIQQKGLITIPDLHFESAESKTDQ